ncbi:Uncharacterised protein [Vibrio cholerae]|nr:Uncharacterised protein [Vibrio cholerae]
MTTLLKLGQWALIRARNVIAIGCQVSKTGGLIHHFNHVFCIVFPVGCHMEYTAANHELLAHHFSKFKLHDTALVVAFLVPRIWEE